METYKCMKQKQLWMNETSRGVFEKAGYVPYRGKFKDKLLDNLKVWFQKRR